jgi:hypothetical protein
MKLGKRRKEGEPGGESASVVVADAPTERAPERWSPPPGDPPPDEPADAAEPTEPEPAVDGEAVELPAEPLPPEPAPEPALARPVPLAMREPRAPRVAAAAPVAPAPPVLSSVDPVAAAAGSPSVDGHAHDPFRQPIEVLAAERPELVVGAAFAGGILAAMILRRLGN